MRHLLLLLLLPLGLSAQRTLTGTVIDAADGSPLSFVSVFVKSNQSRGVLTNERGEYTLTLTEDELTDELLFSLLSYETASVNLSQLDTGQTIINQQLTTSFLELAEITVISDLGLRALVRKVIEKIPDNYGAEKYLLRGYTRKFSIDDGEYSQIIESMITLRDTRYEDPDKDPKVWIDQFRMSNYQGDAREDMRLYNNGRHTLLGGYLSPFDNPARAQTLHWLGMMDRTLDKMTFANRGEYVSNGDTLVKIQYGLRTDNRDLSEAQQKAYASYLNGEVLINKSDYAMVRNTQGEVDKGWYRDVVYQKINGKYYPKKISAEVQFEYNLHTQTSYRTNLLYVTEVITDPKAIKQTKKGKPLVLEGKLATIKSDYAPDFWANNEILQLLPAPDALQSGLERLNKLEDQFRGNARRVKE